MIPALLAATALAGPLVGPGVYRPVYPPSPTETERPMPAFRLDETPVTRGQFAAFVAAHPEWRRDRVSALFTEPGYLGDWASAADPGPGADRPVTQVSWFGARAYCAARGARLPTEAEWEFAASADGTRPDARQDPAFVAQILEWYSRPSPPVLPDVGGPPNVWGVRDLHGLVWEWVEDFDAAMVSTDARDAGGQDEARFCGGGALSAADVADYASFMRIAFRTSLRASYTTSQLGFRCAEDP